MPSRQVSHQVSVPTEPLSTWTSLQDPQTWVTVSGVDAVTDPSHHENGTLAGYRFTQTVGGRTYRGEAVVTASNRPGEMAVAFETTQVEGQIRVTIAPDGSGSVVTTEIEVHSLGMLAAVAFPLIASALATELPESMERFAASLAP